MERGCPTRPATRPGNTHVRSVATVFMVPMCNRGLGRLPINRSSADRVNRADIHDGPGKLRQVLDCASPLALLDLPDAAKAAEDCRTPRRCRVKDRFMVPMRFNKKWRLPMNQKVGLAVPGEPLSRNYADETGGSARALACGGRRPRRPQRRTQTTHPSVMDAQLRSDRRGAGRNTRGRVCSPIPTA